MEIPRSYFNVKYELNYLWLKIFSHDLTKSGYFSDNESEFLLINEDGKFSIIGKITEEFKINEKYEFLLQYPNEADLENQYNHWRQKRFLLESTNFTPDIELENLNLSWDTLWGGLTKSDFVSCTFIDGALKNSVANWWYAIGAKRQNDIPNKLPGPAKLARPTGGATGYEVEHVELWIRIPDDFRFSKHILIVSKCKQYFVSYYMYLLLCAK